MGLGIHFLHARHTVRCTATVDKYFVGYQSIQFVSAGEVELFYGGSRFVVKAPAFWTCYPGPHIRFHGNEGKAWNHRYAAVTGPGLLPWQQMGLWFQGVQNCPSREALSCARRMDQVIRLSSANRPLSTLRAANVLESLLLDLVKWRRAGIQKESWLSEVIEKLETGQTSTGYQNIARRCGMAESTLRRRFRQATGMSLHHYMLECRITKACHLVANTNLSIKEIAARLGYDNEFYFSRQFHKYRGVAPLWYRKSQQIK